MKLAYDQNADALYIEVVGGEPPVSRTEEIDASTLVDLDRLGRVLGIEVLRPARRWPLNDILDRFDIDPEEATLLRATFEQQGGEVFPFTRPRELIA